jgi:hypothetical protein
MNLKDKIIKKEAEFFQREVKSPKYLILAPHAYEELKFILAEEEGEDPEDAFLKTITHYSGLKVAILPGPTGLDIDLC